MRRLLLRHCRILMWRLFLPTPRAGVIWKITISSGSLSCNGYFRAECSIPYEKYKTAMAVATKYLAKEVFKDMTTFDKFVKNNIR